MRVCRTKDDKEFQMKSEYYDKVKYTCKCGHRVIIPKWVDKQICDWCNCYVFKNKQDEFKYRLEEKMKKGEKNER